jgi:hypothetical protein
MAKRHKPWIDVEIDIHSRRTLEYVATMPDRKDAIIRAVPYILANETLKGLMRRIPSKDEFRAYRESLKIAKVKGLNPSQEASYVVRSDIKSRRVGKLEQDKVVLYVRAKTARPARISKDVQLLIDLGPWTLDTIPFWPPSSKAIVVKRKVSKREVMDIRKKQEKQKQKVRSAMMGAGKKIDTKASLSGPRALVGKAVPDVMGQAISLEFGGDGTRAVPAWRQSINEARSIGMKQAPRRYSRLHEMMYSPRSKRWRNWPKVDDDVTSTEVADYQGFRKKLGY